MGVGGLLRKRRFNVETSGSRAGFYTVEEQGFNRDWARL